MTWSLFRLFILAVLAKRTYRAAYLADVTISGNKHSGKTWAPADVFFFFALWLLALFARRFTCKWMRTRSSLVELRANETGAASTHASSRRRLIFEGHAPVSIPAASEAGRTDQVRRPPRTSRAAHGVAAASEASCACVACSPVSAVRSSPGSSALTVIPERSKLLGRGAGESLEPGFRCRGGAPPRVLPFFPAREADVIDASILAGLHRRTAGLGEEKRSGEVSRRWRRRPLVAVRIRKVACA